LEELKDKNKKLLSVKFVQNTSVFNLSNISLSPLQSSVLGLGLKFIPAVRKSSKNIKQSIINSLNTLNRRLQIRLYFAGQLSSSQIIPSIINNDWLPPRDQLPSSDYLCFIDSFISEKIDIIKNSHFNSQLNSVDQLINETLLELHKRKDIKIIPADKNLGTVIISRSDYNAMCYKILNDNLTYEIVNHDSFNALASQKLRLILSKHKRLWSSFSNNKRVLSPLAKSILQLEKSNLLRKAGKFYVLPKMHKVPVAGRPIVSCINTITYHASKYLDNLLKPLLKKIPSICSSSREVIYNLTNFKCKPGSVLLCADVKNLYPSIPIDYGLKAVKSILKQYHYCSEDSDFIVDLLRWVLTHNYLYFDEKTFLQKCGTAMGTPVAVVYSNIVLFYLEQRCLNLNPQYYRRYIDDLFIICDDKSHALAIVNKFNQQNPNIQLDPASVTINTCGVFLDLEISIIHSSIHFKLFQKPANKYLYIPPSSKHPTVMLKNIITQELCRYRLFCSLQSDFEEFSAKFKQRLLQRGYSPLFLQPLFAFTPNRSHLIEQNKVIIQRQYKLKSSSSNKITNDANNKKPIITLNIPKCFSTVNLNKSFFTIPHHITNHSRYVKVFSCNNIVIGKSLGPSVARILGREESHCTVPDLLGPTP
jgi:hypothetical protein